MVLAHRVLGVDDNPRNLAILEKALNGQFELVTVSSGEEALEIAPRFRPDLILLDIMMPGIDGYETCRRLRACHAVKSAKILMVSAKALASDRLEGYAAGADDYVTKPFDIDELVAKLRVYLRLKSVEEINSLKSDLLALLGHETRTPLTTILCPTELLLKDPSLTSSQREMVEMARTGGLRLQTLVEAVNYLTQLRAGLAPRKSKALDFETIATDAVARAHARTSRGDAKVELSVESPLQIEGDATQVRYVLQALVDNALRLSPPSGLVRLRAHSDGTWSRISVSDQGPGLAPDAMARVFDEFAAEDLQHHGRGLGLSLATARVIVEQHGGSLSVESEIGRGATFHVLFPTPLAAAEAA